MLIVGVRRALVWEAPSEAVVFSVIPALTLRSALDGMHSGVAVVE